MPDSFILSATGINGTVSGDNNMSPRPVRQVPFAIRGLVSELDRALAGCHRILEIGCGPDSALQYLPREAEIEGLDIHEPWLLKAKERGVLRKYHLANAMDIDSLFQPGEFDAVVALDLIEHLEFAILQCESLERRFRAGADGQGEG